MYLTDIKKYFKTSNLAFMKSVHIEKIIFDDRAKYMCKYGCKNYNRKYSCPPSSLYLKNKILSEYSKCLLFATTYKIPNKSSRYQTRIYNYKKEYEIQRISLHIDNLFCKYNLEHFVLTGGSCKRCKHCSYLDNQKCKKPSKKQVSMEAIGIDCQLTMHEAGFDFQLPNNGSINRCGCIFLNDEGCKDLELKKKKSKQSFYKPTIKDVLEMCCKLKNGYPKLFKNVSLLNISELINDEIICNSDCSHYSNNFACPPFSKKINLNLWNYAILWEWKENKYKKYRYNQALKILHGGFYSLGFYFTFSLRNCYCAECNECTYSTGNKSTCDYRKLLAVSMQSQGINPMQFGNGKYGIELL